MYLERAVNSVLKQDLQDFEIILCDNSTDSECTELCKKLANNNEKIKVLFAEPKCGPGAARNKGLDYAQGKYVYFMDADDYIESNTLSDNVAIAEKYDCDIVRFGFTSLIADNDGKIVSKKAILPAFDGLYTFDMLKENFAQYLESTSYSVWSRLYKKDAIQKVRFEQYTTAEDAIFNFDLLINGINNIYFNRKSYYYYIGRPSSIMGKYNPNRYKNELKLLNHIEFVVCNWQNSNELMDKINQMHVQSFLMEYNNFTLPGCKLTISEAANIVKDIYNSVEMKAIIKSVPISKIPQPTAKICYILSKHKLFRTAVLFKRVYIPISYFVNRFRMRLWNLIENQTV